MQLTDLKLWTEKAKDLWFQYILDTIDDILKLNKELDLDENLKTEIEWIQGSLKTIIEKWNRIDTKISENSSIIYCETVDNVLDILKSKLYWFEKSDLEEFDETDLEELKNDKIMELEDLKEKAENDLNDYKKSDNIDTNILAAKIREKKEYKANYENLILLEKIISDINNFRNKLNRILENKEEQVTIEPVIKKTFIEPKKEVTKSKINKPIAKPKQAIQPAKKVEEIKLDLSKIEELYLKDDFLDQIKDWWDELSSVQKLEICSFLLWKKDKEKLEWLFKAGDYNYWKNNEIIDEITNFLLEVKEVKKLDNLNNLKKIELFILDNKLDYNKVEDLKKVVKLLNENYDYNCLIKDFYFWNYNQYKYNIFRFILEISHILKKEEDFFKYINNLESVSFNYLKKLTYSFLEKDILNIDKSEKIRKMLDKIKSITKKTDFEQKLLDLYDEKYPHIEEEDEEILEVKEKIKPKVEKSFIEPVIKIEPEIIAENVEVEKEIPLTDEEKFEEETWYKLTKEFFDNNNFDSQQTFIKKLSESNLKWLEKYEFIQDFIIENSEKLSDNFIKQYAEKFWLEIEEEEAVLEEDKPGIETKNTNVVNLSKDDIACINLSWIQKIKQVKPYEKTHNKWNKLTWNKLEIEKIEQSLDYYFSNFRKWENIFSENFIKYTKVYGCVEKIL